MTWCSFQLDHAMKLRDTLPLLSVLLLSCEHDEQSHTPNPRDEYVEGLEARISSMEELVHGLNQELIHNIAEKEQELAALQAKLIRLAPKTPTSVKLPTQNTPLSPAKTIDSGEDRAEARREACGERLGTVRTLDGRTLHDVEIVRVTDVGLEIRHRNGASRLHYNDLPSHFGERFSYVPALARKALQLERLATIERKEHLKNSLLDQIRRESRRRDASLANRISYPENHQYDQGHTISVEDNYPPTTVIEKTVIVEQPVFIGSPQQPSCSPPVVIFPPKVRPIAVKPPLVRPPVVNRPIIPVRPGPTRPTPTRPSVQPKPKPPLVAARPAPTRPNPAATRPSATPLRTTPQRPTQLRPSNRR